MFHPSYKAPYYAVMAAACSSSSILFDHRRQFYSTSLTLSARHRLTRTQGILRVSSRFNFLTSRQILIKFGINVMQFQARHGRIFQLSSH